MSARLFSPSIRLASSAAFRTSTCTQQRFAKPILACSSRAMSSSGSADTGRGAGAGVGSKPIDPKEASQVRGHVVWIKGVAEEVVGRVSGAKNWLEAGREDKARGIQEMRVAKDEGDKKLHLEKRSPTILSVEGASEKVAGYMTGCAGMKERGIQKQQAAKIKGT